MGTQSATADYAFARQDNGDDASNLEAARGSSTVPQEHRLPLRQRLAPARRGERRFPACMWEPSHQGARGGVGGHATLYDPAAAAGEGSPLHGYDGNAKVVSLVGSGTAPGVGDTYEVGELASIVGGPARTKPSRLSPDAQRCCRASQPAATTVAPGVPVYGFRYYSPGRGGGCRVTLLEKLGD